MINKLLVLCFHSIIFPFLVMGQSYLDEVSLPNQLKCGKNSLQPEIEFIEVRRIDHITPSQYRFKADQKIFFDEVGRIENIQYFHGKELTDSVSFSYMDDHQLKWVKTHTGDPLQLSELVEFKFDEKSNLPSKLIRRGVVNIDIQEVVMKTADHIYIRFWEMGKSKRVVKFPFKVNEGCIPYAIDREIKNPSGQIIIETTEIPDPKNKKRNKLLVSEYDYDDRNNWIKLSSFLMNKESKKRKRDLALTIERTIHYRK